MPTLGIAGSGHLGSAAAHIPALARPSSAADRSALPIAGNDTQAKTEAAAIIDRLGFDTVDARTLADS